MNSDEARIKVGIALIRLRACIHCEQHRRREDSGEHEVSSLDD
jgi:hypothetical protein